MVQWCQDALFCNNQCHIFPHEGEEILSTDQRRTQSTLASTFPSYLALTPHPSALKMSSTTTFSAKYC